MPRLVGLEHVVQEAGAARLGEELGAEADETTRGNEELEAGPPGAVVDDLLHPTLADREELGDGAEELLGHVDGHAVDRLVHLAVDRAGHHGGLADGELEALAAHRLHQHRELELAAALHLPRVGTLAREHAQRHVAHHLGVEAVLHEAGGHLVAVLPGERRGVDADRHREAGVVDVHDRQRARVVEVGEGLADGDVGQAGDHADLTRADLGGGDAVDALGHEQLGDADGLDGAVGAAPRDRLVAHEGAVVHAGEREAAEVRRRVEVGDEGLERVVLVVLGRGDVVEQHAEQRLEAVGADGAALTQRRVVGVERRATGARVAVHDREVDLVLVGVEVEEQLLHLVDHLGDAGVGAVDLVDDDHHRQPSLERLAQHEAGLGEGPLARVDEEEHAVDHGEAPLDLATEVGVARGVDDVDLHALDGDRGVLGQDRDALLTLEVGVVHDPVHHLGVDAERPALAEHGVDEGGLAVVDVGHDGHVAEVGARSDDRAFRVGRGRGRRHRGTGTTRLPP